MLFLSQLAQVPNVVLFHVIRSQTKFRVNQHCLFNTQSEAKEALESGKFNDSEPGPFRIFAVYLVEAF